MKIVLTGGGTGGHFYPIIAVIEELRRIAREKKLVKFSLVYMASTPYDDHALFERDVEFRKIPAGKVRGYASLLNVFDPLKTAAGVVKALFSLFSLFPDVIFGKGGYDSVPVLIAARILGIPVVIHESDSTPGRANLYAGKFAKKIAVGFADAAHFFPKEKVAYTGTPVRPNLFTPQTEGAHEFLGLEKSTPVITVFGGSQGARAINDRVLEALPALLTNYQVIHQTGKAHIADTTALAGVMLRDHPHAYRYKPFAYLNELALKMVAGATDLFVTRGGAEALAEIAIWGKPSIVIPLPSAKGDHQRKNAFAFAHEGAAVVIEEKNLTVSIVVAEINRLMENPGERTRMGQAARAFARPDAAEIIAEELIAIGLAHEK